MLKYKIISDKYTSEELGDYTGYGIIAVDNDKIICSADDITDDPNQLEELVYIMNESGTEFIHFHDIVEEFIG